MDIYSPEKRSTIMSKVRSKGTTPEIVVRRTLYALGLRYRLHANDLPGRPDIVLPKYRSAIFVHGCFWHRHKSCNKSKLPSTNAKFWSDKISANAKRDKRNISRLKRQGWRVLVLWECDTVSARFTGKLIRFLKRAEATKIL